MNRTNIAFAMSYLLLAIFVVAQAAQHPGAAFAQSNIKHDTAQIKHLVKLLNSASFRKREIATKKLMEIGEPALDALRRAAATGNLEVRSRAMLLINHIGRSWQLRVINGHNDAVPEISVSPDGRFVLAACRSEGILRLWDIDAGKEIRRYAVVKKDPFIRLGGGGRGRIRRLGGLRLAVRNNWTWGVAFSPDGKHALSADGNMYLWDVKTGKTIRQFATGSHNVTACAYSPSGELALTGSDKDTSARLWDIRTGKELRRFNGHSQPDVNVAFSPDESRALTCSRDGTIRVWDLKTGTQLLCLKGHTAMVTAAVFSENGKRVISSSWDKTLRLWDAESGKPLRIFRGHTDKVCDVKLSPDGGMALSGSFDTTVILWNVQTGKLLRRFKGHTEIVGSVAYSPNGRIAMSASYDKTIRLWKLPK